MTATLDALNADAGVSLSTIVVIEGCPYGLTDGDPELAQLALAGSSLNGPSDVERVFGGLKVHWDLGQKLEPWKPLGDPPTLSFSVVPAQDNSGDLVTYDTFGELVGRRKASIESYLASALDCDDTTVTVQRVAGFSPPGTAYVGPEAIGYASVSGGLNQLQTLTRGKYSPFQTQSGGRFVRSHRYIDLTSSTGDPVGVRLSSKVTSSPTDWIGRWVGVWLVRNVGGSLDLLDEAHLAFAGYIAEIGEDESGAVVVQLEHALRRIYETVLNPTPWSAQLRGGLTLQPGQTFLASTSRNGTGATANPLTVVLSGASTANEIDYGNYTAAELNDKINRWLASEYAAGRLQFRCRLSIISTADGSRAYASLNDGTTTANLNREWILSFPNAGVGDFMGWGGASLSITSTTKDGVVESPDAPLRLTFSSTGTANVDQLYQIAIDDARGTWQSQQSSLPPALVDSNQLISGIAKVGELGYVRVQYISDSLIAIAPGGLGSYFPSAAAGLNSARITIDDATDLTVTQVICMEGQFRDLLRKILASTGTSAFNHPTYDSLAEGLGCAIPWSILGDDFDSEIASLPSGEKSLCAIIDKPTRFSDLFESDFLVRACFFRWAAGRLGIASWQLPASGTAAITLDETSKAVPAAMADGDAQRASLREDDGSLYNVVSFKYGRRPDGSYAGIETIQDATSIRSHGSRIRTIELINSTAGGAAAGDTRALLDEFSSIMPLFSRPFYRIKRTLARTHFEQATIGTPVLLTDRYLRNPDTGLRYSHVTGTGGLSSQPALVIGSDFEWGGQGTDTGGELELMVVPRSDVAPYAPCAQVDDTASAGGFSSGYNSATSTLRCYAHEHSESTEPADATRFVAGDKIRIVQIDPSTAASPITWTREVQSQSGNDIVLTSALSAPAWDSTKKYRITYDSYTAVVAAQQSYAYLADDADGLVANSRGAYQMFGYQGQTYTAVSSALDYPSRHATLAYAEGNALDVGYERDIARLHNNFRDYRSAPQCPQPYQSARTHSAGTWQLVDVIGFFAQPCAYQIWQTRRAYLAPQMRSTTGGTAECRFTLSPFPPSGSSYSDVTRVQPYVSATFTTTSTSYTTPTEQGFDLRHLAISPTSAGWLYVEIKANTEFRGFGRWFIGAVETP